MLEIDDQFYKYPKLLMRADSYVSPKTGEIIQLGEIEKNIYVVMKARNMYFESHYDKQSDIAKMCNVSLRKAASVIRDFIDHGVIEATKAYHGGEHKNLKYTKVHCLELMQRLTESDRKGKIILSELKPLGKLPESLWVKLDKKPKQIVMTIKDKSIEEFDIPF